MRLISLIFVCFSLFSTPGPAFDGVVEVLRCDILVQDQEVHESGSLRIYRDKQNASFIAEVKHLGPDTEGIFKEITWGTAQEIIHDISKADEGTYEVLKALADINDVPWHRVAVVHVIRVNPILDGSLATLYVYKNEEGDIIRKSATLGFMPIECQPDPYYDPAGQDLLELIEEMI